MIPVEDMNIFMRIKVYNYLCEAVIETDMKEKQLKTDVLKKKFKRCVKYYCCKFIFSETTGSIFAFVEIFFVPNTSGK